MRQFLSAGLCIVAGLCVLATGGREAIAQSFFEKLFGLGDSRPQQPAVNSTPKISVPRPVFERDLQRREREMQPARVSAETSDVVQTMCVRTCDGYYWPVRYPATQADFSKDAKVCASTCGAEAKLFYRTGPGTEPEEMKDAAGNSYGASKTAFAYRKGLVKGCSCRSMPWSEAERARHEGYALAEAEKALRLAEAEAQRVGADVAAAEKAANDKKHGQLAAAILDAEAKRDQRGFEPGPAEAAAIAGFAAVEGGASPAVAAVPNAKRAGAKERRKAQYVKQGPAPVQRVRLPRGYAAAGVRPVAPKYAAAASKAWWE